MRSTDTFTDTQSSEASPAVVTATRDEPNDNGDLGDSSDEEPPPFFFVWSFFGYAEASLINLLAF